MNQLGGMRPQMNPQQMQQLQMQRMQQMQQQQQQMQMQQGQQGQGAQQGGQQHPMQPPAHRMPMPQPSPAGVDPSKLATMSPEQQKNLLGEKLFARINEIQPDSAAKITGMLLEMDNSEIINLLDSPELLKSKVVEAVNVLKDHMA
eukprot:TRINITY_DN28246_c0_g1_i1.p2 TRINITY_DN28246_c0_g1~~TRINITY_DN28246_c0_g1_i1.p2  ORF type:complete len:146 (+),score=80.75 TRINITY_DN28246_c0_g1_i1:3-440(+)